jgi:hypothetical protein
MELKTVAAEALGSLMHLTLKCYRCLREEEFGGDSHADILPKAIRKGWRRVGPRYTCKKCSK